MTGEPASQGAFPASRRVGFWRRLGAVVAVVTVAVLAVTAVAVVVADTLRGPPVVRPAAAFTLGSPAGWGAGPVAFTPDGRTLVGSDGARIYLWSIPVS